MPRRQNSVGEVLSEEEYLVKLNAEAVKDSVKKKRRGRPFGSRNGANKKTEVLFKVTHQTYLLTFD